jgi:hypothetical protein
MDCCLAACPTSPSVLLLVLSCLQQVHVFNIWCLPHSSQHDPTNQVPVTWIVSTAGC